MKSVILAGIAALALSSTAMAQRMIAIDSSRVMYDVNLATGAKTPFATATANAGTTAGLAYDVAGDIMYLTSTGNDSVYTLDATGNAVLIGAYGDPAIVMHGLEYDPTTGKLYGVSSHNNGLYDISKTTGVATLIGTSGLSSFTNLGYNSDTNIMYATNSGADSFYTMNLATGATTLIGPLTGPTNPNGLAYNSDNGKLYLADNTTDNLYTIDMQTGLATLIGSMGAGNVLGLAYIPAPVAACYPDCNGDMILNLADFGCFQTAFATGNMYADCNGDTLLNLADFGCFQTKFAIGCP